MRRVVITGLGAVCPLGSGPENVYRAIQEQRCVTRVIPEWAKIAGMRTRIAGKIADFELPAEYPRKKQFAEAFKDALEGRRREQSLGGPLGIFLKQATDELQTLNRFNDPRGLYVRLPFDLRLNQ